MYSKAIVVRLYLTLLTKLIAVNIHIVRYTRMSTSFSMPCRFARPRSRLPCAVMIVLRGRSVAFITLSNAETPAHPSGFHPKILHQCAVVIHVASESTSCLEDYEC